jgi:acetyltransferase-like isoleucine patch superfamily enzyme
LRRDIPPYAGLTRILLAERAMRYGWTIGDHSYGLPLVLEEEWGPLTIGRFCSIASTTLILGNHAMDRGTTYPFDTLGGWWPGRPDGLQCHGGEGIHIGSDVWLGHQSIILPGSLIGHGAVIGAGAVVRGPIPDYAIVTGNPAIIIKYRFDPPTIQRLLRRPWWDMPDATIDSLLPLLTAPDIEPFLERIESGERLHP